MESCFGLPGLVEEKWSSFRLSRYFPIFPVPPHPSGDSCTQHTGSLLLNRFADIPQERSDMHKIVGNVPALATLYQPNEVRIVA